MLGRLARILFGFGALLAVSGCPHITPDKSAREWMMDGRVHCAQERWEDAIADFTEVLRMQPRSRDALVQRAHARLNNGDAEQALLDCQAALDLQPNDIDLLRFRASIYRRQGEIDTADRLDREANKRPPPSADRLHQRGDREIHMGDYASASRHFERALKLEPHNSKYLNDVAWLRAACPDGEFRNGHRAVEFALQACQLTEWSDPAILETLAAAYAEIGQFDKAVKMQQKAVDLMPPTAQDESRRRLTLYGEGKPYRFVNGR